MTGPTGPDPAGLEPAALAVAALAVVFVYNVRRNYIMPDDAFISFRYADHLARGEGLVWNPGERVEGYTNFLWVVLLAAGMRLGVVPQATSTVLNSASAVALLIGIFLLSARFYGRRSPFAWLPVVVLVTSASFTAWCSGGLATMFFTALVFFAYLAFLRERRQPTAWFYPSTLLFTLATLTRPEGALHFAVAGLFFLADLFWRKRPLTAALVWGLPWALAVGAHLLWRHAYYGFWLPNTYYAKVGGELWWGQSLRYFQSFSQMYHLEWFLPLALLAVCWRPRYVHLLFAVAVGLHALYVASVGGDYLEFRFLVMIFPYLYWLIVAGVERLAGFGRGQAALGWRGGAAACAVALVATTATGELKGASLKDLFRLGVGTIDFMQLTTESWTEQALFLRQLIDEGLLPEDTVLAIGGAGVIPYYTRLPTIDIVGLNDVHVAHSTPDSDIPLIGHRHMASIDYLRQREVVIWPAIGVTVVFDQPVLDVSDDPLFVDAPPRPSPPLPLRIVKARDRYLIFVTLVPEEKFRQVFERLEILQ